MFARAFSTVTWNLVCRGDLTSQVLAKHLIWRVDSTGISFSHSKEEQTDSDQQKRQPRHCYANPLEWRADMMSCVFDYLACFPEVFLGKVDSVTSCYSKILDLTLQRHKEELHQLG
jgi:hypothetical protein